MFVGFFTQFFIPSNVCMWNVETRAYTKLTFHLHHAHHNCSILHCTLVWFCRKTYLHQTPSWLWLVRTNSPSPHQGMEQSAQWYKFCPDSTVSEVLWTRPQIPGHYHIQSIDRIKMANDYNLK